MDVDTQMRKMEIDFSGTVEKLIPESLALAKSGSVSEAVDKLLAMEKQTRLAADVFSTEKILVTIVRLGQTFRSHCLQLIEILSFVFNK